jgi:hypothetical protein
VFDAKICETTGGIFGVSAYGEGNKRNFRNCDFCFQLPSLLVEIRIEFNLFILAVESAEKYRISPGGLPVTMSMIACRISEFALMPKGP